MQTLELDLPRHLYVESRDEQGNVTGVTYAADKLISWSEYGGGSAIERWCRKKYDRDIEAIDAWEEQRILVLEEQWQEEENGHDDDAAEARYDQACAAITAEAGRKRAAAMAHLKARKAAIKKLVLQSRRHLAEQQPAEPVDYTFGFLLAAGAAAVMAFWLLA